MTSLNEFDFRTIKWIQELRSCKVAQATEIYRKCANRLANPDHAQRHEIIWEAVQRGAGMAVKQVEQETETPAAKELKKLNEITENQKKEKAMPKAKKEAKAKTATKKVKEPSVARPKVELAELSREIELTPVGEEFKHVFTANLFGKKHAVIQAEIDHSKGAEDRFGFIPVSVVRMKQAQDYSASNGSLPLAVAAVVRVKGRLDQGYAVPRDTFEKFSLKGKYAMTLSGKARLAYREDGWDGCKFSVAKLEEKAAA